MPRFPVFEKVRRLSVGVGREIATILSKRLKKLIPGDFCGLAYGMDGARALWGGWPMFRSYLQRHRVMRLAFEVIVMLGTAAVCSYLIIQLH